MSELTIVIDDWGHKELKDYLMSLKGILDVDVKNGDLLEIYLKYDFSLITANMIKMEIIWFLDIVKIPSIISFDKHPKFETSNYIITRDDLCCENCYKGAIEDLFEIDGIEIVKSNYYVGDLLRKDGKSEKVIINIEYNSNIISLEEMKQIELKLNI